MTTCRTFSAKKINTAESRQSPASRLGPGGSFRTDSLILIIRFLSTGQCCEKTLLVVVKQVSSRHHLPTTMSVILKDPAAERIVGSADNHLLGSGIFFKPRAWGRGWGIKQLRCPCLKL